MILRHERRVGTWQAAEDGEAWTTRRTSRSPRRRGTLAPELAGEVLAAGKLYANNATEADIVATNPARTPASSMLRLRAEGRFFKSSGIDCRRESRRPR